MVTTTIDMTARAVTIANVGMDSSGLREGLGNPASTFVMFVYLFIYLF